jgi:hypothetical protein
MNFFALFAVNSLVIALANLYFPEDVVLGTSYITREWAIIHSMSTLALINIFVIPMVREYEEIKWKMLSKIQWIKLYFVVNLAGIWIIARLSEQLGMGLKSWRVVFVLAIAFDFAQTISMMYIEKSRKKRNQY